MPKPSGIAGRNADLFHGFPSGLDYGADHHLGDAIPGMQDLLFIGKVDQDDLYLTAIIGIDGAGGVETGNTLLDGQSAAWPYLRLITQGEFHV